MVKQIKIKAKKALKRKGSKEQIIALRECTKLLRHLRNLGYEQSISYCEAKVYNLEREIEAGLSSGL